MVSFLQLRWTDPLIPGIIARLVHATVPILFWAGHDEARLISAAFADKHAIQLKRSAPSPTDDLAEFDLVLPRSWKDLHGKTDTDVAMKAVRVLLGWILTRPGMSKVSSLRVVPCSKLQ